MKLTLLSILLILNSCSKSKDRSAPVSNYEVKKSIKVNLKNKARGITGSYWIDENNCALKWSYSISSSKNEKNITLEIIEMRENKKCKQGVSKMLEMHSEIIEKFKAEYSVKKVRAIKVRGLRAIDPLKSCNKEVAIVSSNNKLYQDYREKYPRHDSKMSLNEIFQKIVIDNKICSKFFDLVKEKGLPYTILSAERIFTHKKNRLRKYFDSVEKLSSRVMWDSGYFYLK